MAHRVAHEVFEKYHRARLEFATQVADMASKPHYLESLLDEDAIVQLRRLLADKVPSVQHTAAMALGRLAGYSVELSEELVRSRVLEELAASMESAGRYHQRACAFVVRAVATHSPELADACVRAGATTRLSACLEVQDAGVREGAADALAVVASHTRALANRAVIESGALVRLVASARDPEPGLKRACVRCLAETAKHSTEMAEAVVEAGAVTQLGAMQTSPDARVRRMALRCTADVAKHSPELAELVVEGGAFPSALRLLQDPEPNVRKAAAVATREVVRHSEALAALAAKAGAVGYLVDYMGASAGGAGAGAGAGVSSSSSSTKRLGLATGALATVGAGGGAARLPAVMALGFLAASSESLSMAVVRGGGCDELKDALINEPEDHVKAASAWALGHAGRWSARHADALAEGDVLRHLLAAALHEDASDDLRAKAQSALRAIVGPCTRLDALCPLLSASPPPLAREMLRRAVAVLPEDARQRQQLVESGGLRQVLALREGPSGEDPGVAELVDEVGACFPAEVTDFCSPGFQERLADRVAARHEAKRRQELAAARAKSAGAASPVGGMGGLSGGASGGLSGSDESKEEMDGVAGGKG